MDGLAGSQKACLALGSGVWGLSPIASFFELVFEGAFFRLFLKLGRFWEVFGRPKRRPKSIFGIFFFDVFFECVSASILGGFLKAQDLKISDFPIGKPQIS